MFGMIKSWFTKKTKADDKFTEYWSDYFLFHTHSGHKVYMIEVDGSDVISKRGRLYVFSDKLKAEKALYKLKNSCTNMDYAIIKERILK